VRAAPSVLGRTGLVDLDPDGTRHLDKAALADAWSTMPITPTELESPAASHEDGSPV
jgi:hypothetical protein